MQNHLIELFKETKPECVVETGTYLGTGTTTLLWNARQAARLNTRIVTIECNPKNYRDACHHFRRKNMLIDARLGLSIPKSSLPDFNEIQRVYVELEHSRNGEIYYDHKPSERASAYYRETDFNVPDDLLHSVIADHRLPPIRLFLLDSAGHVGTIEFVRLVKLMNLFQSKIAWPVYLLLDDTRHCKHERTLAFLKNQPDWDVVHESVGDRHQAVPGRFGWALLRYRYGVPWWTHPHVIHANASAFR